MKTKLILITSLIGAGLIMFSCQKEDELTPATADEKTVVSENALPANYQIKEVDPGLQVDPLTNFPDPFFSQTTIKFIVKKEGYVKLSVSKIGSEAGAINIVLFDGYKKAGIYSKVLDAQNLPLGEYMAILDVSGTISKELMTKSTNWPANPAGE